MVTLQIPETLSNHDIIKMTPLDLIEVQRQAAAPVIAQLNDAVVSIKTLQDTATENEKVYRGALDKIEGLLRTNRDQATEIDRLKARIAQLEFAQPPVTPPVVFPTDPVKPPHADPVYPFCGGYFEDPRENDSVDSQAEAEQHFNALRPSMEFAAEHNPSMGDYIVFGNLIDFKHGGTVKEILRLGKRPWLSPVQAYYGKPQFTDHLKAAHDAGFYGVIIDDAHNVKDFIVPLLDAVNRYMPNAPVICSFGAEFDDSAYPRERYYDMRQWFISAREKESVYFQRWETSQDAALYAADVYRRGNGFQHTPERVRSMFDTAMPFVEGVAFYSLLNQQTHIMNDNKKMKAQNPDALTVWDVIVECSTVYQKTYEARRVTA